MVRAISGEWARKTSWPMQVLYQCDILFVISYKVEERGRWGDYKLKRVYFRQYSNLAGADRVFSCGVNQWGNTYTWGSLILQ